MFADHNTTIIAVMVSSDYRRPEKIDKVARLKNKLTIEVDRCETISFGRGKPDKNTITSIDLPYQKACKFFVANLENSLNFREHIDYVTENSMNSAV